MAQRTARDASRKLVLVVDDEATLVDTLRAYLEDEGFVVTSACDGIAALEIAARDRPDLVLLDLNVPRCSGLDVFRDLRKLSDVPVIMLTARGSEIDRIVGLELGADDYVAKPFSPREVVARVKAVLRRAQGPAAIPEIHERDVTRIADLEIDRTSHEVHRRGHRIDLTPTEFRVLDVLASHVGRAFTREQILERVADGEVFDRTLDRHVANLRHKIEDEPTRPALIVTVLGVGYKCAESPRKGRK